MNLINTIFNSLFDLLFLPFKNGNPAWPLLVISIVTGIAMLFVFKATSNQSGIKQAKNLVKGHFLAIRLYKDDIGLMFNTMKNIMVSNLLYMKQSLRPMLFLLVPTGLILIQLGVRYEYRPLHAGESTIVSLTLDDGANIDDVELRLPDGLFLEIPPVRIKQLREINWRVKAGKPGKYTLAFAHSSEIVEKRLLVVDKLVPVASKIASDDFSVALLNPSESSLPVSSFAASVSVVYPFREFEFAGFGTHWLIAFFVVSLVAAFGLKGFLGVEV